MAYSMQDLQVQATNDDAASSKCSAVQLGYWHDPYIQLFTKPCPRKSPEMNRGYYIRIKGIEFLLKQFLQKCELKCQVVNLGAGFDTSFWNFNDQGLIPLSWVDVDFEAVSSKKIKNIRLKKVLIEKLKATHGDSANANTEVNVNMAELHSNVYHCVSCDLRSVAELETALRDKCSLNFNLPTAFVCECVLVYMDAVESDSLVKWIANNFNSALFVNYEQVNMGDRFGEVMLENLKARGCGLIGVEHCASLKSQVDRFLKNGWTTAAGANMLQIYRGMPEEDIKSSTKMLIWLMITLMMLTEYLYE